MRSLGDVLRTLANGVKGMFGWPPVDPAIVAALERIEAPDYVVSWALSYGADNSRLWAECPRADRLLLIAAAVGVDRDLIRSALAATAARAGREGQDAADGAPGEWVRALEIARAQALRWAEGHGKLEPALALLRDALEDVVSLLTALATEEDRQVESLAVDDELREASGARAPVLGLGKQRAVLAERRAKTRVEDAHRVFADVVRGAIPWTAVDDALHHRYQGLRGPYR